MTDGASIMVAPHASPWHTCAMLLLQLLLSARAAQAACPASAAGLQSTLDSAQLSFSTMDGAGFKAATAEAESQAACLSDSVPAGVVARLHRVLGLRSFVDGDEAAARTAFAAARAIEPDYAFPDAMVPPDHPVRQLYNQSAGAYASTSVVPAPQSGGLEFDGTPSNRRPSERPTLALLVQTNGSVASSAYLWPGDPLFAYTPVAGKVSSTPITKAPVAHRGPNVPLTIVACVALAAAGTTWGLASVAHNDFETSTSTDYKTLEALRGKTNTLFFTSVGAGVVTLGAGVGAVVAGHW